MNARQLKKLGVPSDCVKIAIEGVKKASLQKFRGRQIKESIAKIVNDPDSFTDDENFADFAKAMIADREFVLPEPIVYTTWGEDINENAHQQMAQACGVPMATGAALMPDAHLGYGLPIGGVLATENAVIPYAVGVDIACRMKMSVLDMPVDSLENRFNLYKEALEGGTRFGVGSKHEKPQDHAVMDQDWTVSRIIREKKDTAWTQLGSSGSGNHFVEFGVLELNERVDEIDLEAGRYVALLSHSGSRGAGAAVCSTYSSIARGKLHNKYKDFAHLAWLTMDSQEGQEYWASMNLMGDYAAANHDVIHKLVSKLLGSQIVAGIENHHNFAWKEIHNGKEVIVHRKGATPAGKGVLGVIPGSMASPAFVVRGKGNAESLDSASHGAGRLMSRRKAKDKYNFKSVQNDLKKKGVTVISAGADEVPGVYKNIEEVMAAQNDLVEIISRFDPKIVKMCGDGSKAED